jgi:hypothetical protein
LFLLIGGIDAFAAARKMPAAAVARIVVAAIQPRRAVARELF